MLGSFKPLAAQITKRLDAYSSFAERLKGNYLAILANGPPPKAALPTVLLKECYKILVDPAFSSMTPQQIAGRLASAGMGSVASALSVSAALSHVQVQQLAQVRRFGEAQPELVAAWVRDNPVLWGAYNQYRSERLTMNDFAMPPEVWIKSQGKMKYSVAPANEHYELLPGDESPDVLSAVALRPAPLEVNVQSALARYLKEEGYRQGAVTHQ
jgi:hypothetical protein